MAKQQLARLRAWVQSPRGGAIRTVATTARDSFSVIGFCVLTILVISYFSPAVRAKVLFWQPVQHVLAEEAAKAGVPSPTGNSDWLAEPMANAPTGLDARSQFVFDSLTDKKFGPAKDMTGPMTAEQKQVANYIVKRYRIANDATETLVRSAYQLAKRYQLDPVLILAVAGIESGFNPLAASSVGAKGLMQVMTSVHKDKFASVSDDPRSALHPVSNMQVGAQILKDCIRRGGSLEAGLKLYVGATTPDDGGYASKVTAEYQRMKSAAGGRTVAMVTAPAKSTAKASSKALVEDKGADVFEMAPEKMVSSGSGMLAAR